MVKAITNLIVLAMLWGFAFAPNLLFAQSKSELQKQRDELNKKIELTKKLINESETEQKTTTNQLQMLNQQIAYREELLTNIGEDIGSIEGEIGAKESTIASLNKQLKAMKDEYARMLYHAYKNRSAYNKLMFVFAADDFNQAYKRFKIMQHYSEVRQQHVAAIEQTQIELQKHIGALQTDKTEKQKLLSDKEKEKQKIARDKQQHQQKLTQLQSDEKKLRDQQKKHESDRKKLAAKIEEIIRKEIEEANKPKPGAIPSPVGTPKSLDLAPEAKILNSDFEKNKGGLPWPVASGVITSKFGRQPHASIAGVEINNNGLDFTTEKNANVLAVFSGKVSSVFTIPGAGQNVIVTHGLYKTVYSGLVTVSVKVGDEVSAKQKLGTVMYDGEQHILHFELWKITQDGGVPQNPELWVKKR